MENSHNHFDGVQLEQGWRTAQKRAGDKLRSIVVLAGLELASAVALASALALVLSSSSGA